MNFMVVVTNAKSLADFSAHKTFHFVDASSAEEAQEIALKECFEKGPHGIPFVKGDKVHVDRCIKQNAGRFGAGDEFPGPTTK